MYQHNSYWPYHRGLANQIYVHRSWSTYKDYLTGSILKIIPALSSLTLHRGPHNPLYVHTSVPRNWSTYRTVIRTDPFRRQILILTFSYYAKCKETEPLANNVIWLAQSAQFDHLLIILDLPSLYTGFPIKRRPIAKILKVDIFHYFVSLSSLSRLAMLSIFKKRASFLWNPVHFQRI